jgi:uncharacterized membrane protein
MRWRYIVFIIIAIILYLLSFYYLCAFCAIYERSAENCIIAGFIALLGGFTLESFVNPLIHTFFRSLAMLWPNR